MRKTLIGVSLAVILAGYGCGKTISRVDNIPNFPDSVVIDVVEEPEDIKIPEAIYKKAVEDIDYILEKGYAETLDENDFNHFHILLPRERLVDYFSRNKNEMLLDSNLIFLYHTHEKDIEYRDRNLESTLTKQPRVIRKPKDRDTVYPVDLRCMGLLEVSFKIDENGKYKLKDNRAISFSE